MNTKIAALAVLLMTSAAPAALAQEVEDRPARIEHEPRGGGQAERERPERAERADRTERAERPERVERAERAPEAPRARPAPEAGEAPIAPVPGERRRAGGEGLAGAGRWSGRVGAQTNAVSPLPEVNETGGRRRTDQVAADSQRRPDGARDGRTWSGGDRRDGQGRDGARRDGDQRWDGRRDGRGDGDQRRGDTARRDGDGRNWDGRRDGDRRWNGGGDRQGRWDGRRWDNNGSWNWQSHRRFRGHAWRPPVGFYFRTWVYGDIFPSAWYQPDYRILDWWAFDLPAPPPGMDWIRVGYDALLIDRFDGRVYQVVRMVFW